MTYSTSCMNQYGKSLQLILKFLLVDGTYDEKPNDGICPLGNYCPASSATPKFCPDGAYANGTKVHVGSVKPRYNWCQGNQKSFTCYWQISVSLWSITIVAVCNVAYYGQFFAHQKNS